MQSPGSYQDDSGIGTPTSTQNKSKEKKQQQLSITGLIN